MNRNKSYANQNSKFDLKYYNLKKNYSKKNLMKDNIKDIKKYIEIKKHNNIPNKLKLLKSKWLFKKKIILNNNNDKLFNFNSSKISNSLYFNEDLLTTNRIMNKSNKLEESEEINDKDIIFEKIGQIQKEIKFKLENTTIKKKNNINLHASKKYKKIKQINNEDNKLNWNNFINNNYKKIQNDIKKDFLDEFRCLVFSKKIINFENLLKNNLIVKKFEFMSNLKNNIYSNFFNIDDIYFN